MYIEHQYFFGVNFILSWKNIKSTISSCSGFGDVLYLYFAFHNNQSFLSQTQRRSEFNLTLSKRGGGVTNSDKVGTVAQSSKSQHPRCLEISACKPSFKSTSKEWKKTQILYQHVRSSFRIKDGILVKLEKSDLVPWPAPFILMPTYPLGQTEQPKWAEMDQFSPQISPGMCLLR